MAPLTASPSSPPPRTLQPPYVPEIADAFDVSNFECEGLTTPRNDHKAAAHAGTSHLFEEF